MLTPIGGHAVYLDARALLPQIPPLEYPGQALAVALYEAGVVRSCEIGTVMFGRQPDGSEMAAALDLGLGAAPERSDLDVRPDPLAGGRAFDGRRGGVQAVLTVVGAEDGRAAAWRRGTLLCAH